MRPWPNLPGPGGNVHLRSPHDANIGAETAVRQRPRSIPSLPATQRGSEYARLSRQIKQAGLRKTAADQDEKGSLCC
jgi:hypothetical protein